MNLFLIKEYLHYFYHKTNSSTLESSFFKDFYHNIIKKDTHCTKWESIEKQRQELLKDESLFKVFDLGAGSKVNTSTFRQVKSIARYSLSTPKFSQLLFRLIKHHGFKNIIELGTSLGINTAYLSNAENKSVVYTFEADSKAIEIAKKINRSQENIHFIEGDIGEKLPIVLNEGNKKIDLVYADANHTYDASLQYFNVLLPYLHEKSIYIMDDIHWSPGMKKAWMEIQRREEITASIDLFDAGLLFFHPDFKQEHYILSF